MMRILATVSALSAMFLAQNRDSRFTLPPLPSMRRRGPPTHEQRLRRSGRWSPLMDEPHSEPQVHVRNRISGQHFWMTRADWDALPTRGPRIGDVIEYVNGWGQVTRRERF